MTIQFLRNSFTAAAIIGGLLSTSYAHAGPLYSCVFENGTENSRFEVKVRQDGDDGLFSYNFIPANESAAVQGQFEIVKSNVTWSHFIFTGNDDTLNVKLSVPAGLDDNTIYMQLDAVVNQNPVQFAKYLNCKRAR